MEKIQSTPHSHEQLISECSQSCRSPDVLNYLRAALRYKLATLIVAKTPTGSGGVCGGERSRGMARPVLLLVADVLLAGRFHLTHALLVTESGQQLARAAPHLRQPGPPLDQYEVREVVDWLCPHVSFDSVWRQYCQSDLPLCLVLFGQFANGAGAKQSSSLFPVGDAGGHSTEATVNTTKREERAERHAEREDPAREKPACAPVIRRVSTSTDLVTNEVSVENGFDANKFRQGKLSQNMSDRPPILQQKCRDDQMPSCQSVHPFLDNTGSVISAFSRREINSCFESLLSVIAEKQQTIRKLEEKTVHLEALVRSQPESKSTGNMNATHVPVESIAAQASRNRTRYKRVIDRQESLLKKLTERAMQIDEIWNKSESVFANSVLKSRERSNEMQPKLISVDVSTQVNGTLADREATDRGNIHKTPSSSSNRVEYPRSINKDHRNINHQSNRSDAVPNKHRITNSVAAPVSASKKKSSSRNCMDSKNSEESLGDVDLSRCRISRLWNEVHSLDSQLAAFRTDSDRMQFALQMAKRPMFAGGSDHCDPASGADTILRQHRIFKAASGSLRVSDDDRESKYSFTPVSLSDSFVQLTATSASSLPGFDSSLDPYRFPLVGRNKTQLNTEICAPQQMADFSCAVCSSLQNIPLNASSSIESTCSVSSAIYTKTITKNVVSFSNSMRSIPTMFPFPVTTTIEGVATPVLTSECGSAPMEVNHPPKLIPESAFQVNSHETSTVQISAVPTTDNSDCQTRESSTEITTGIPANPVVESEVRSSNDGFGENLITHGVSLHSPADHRPDSMEDRAETLDLSAVHVERSMEANIRGMNNSAVPAKFPSSQIEVDASTPVDICDRCNIPLRNGVSLASDCEFNSRSSDVGSAISAGVNDAVSNDSDFF